MTAAPPFLTIAEASRLIAAIPRHRPLADDQAYVFRLPPPAPDRQPTPKPIRKPARKRARPTR